MNRVAFKLLLCICISCAALVLIGNYHLNLNIRYWKRCSEENLQLFGRREVDSDVTSAPSFEMIRIFHGVSMEANGHYEPKNCRASHSIAIIVPLRKREKQFRVLLHHLFAVLRRQQVSFTIYAVTQAREGIFNRAKLFNVGIQEALKNKDFDCFIFHDTDLLLEDDRCLYRCNNDHPTHLSAFIDILSYEIMNYSLSCAPPGFPNVISGFGGVSAMTMKQINDVNGFSNKYWGWGGEDDDMIIRLWHKGYSVGRFFGNHCSYSMLQHDHENTNRPNVYRYKLLEDSLTRIDKDGLNNLSYDVVSIERNPLYINITVGIGNELDDFRYARDITNRCIF